MTVGGLVDTVFRFNRLCECHLYTAPRNNYRNSFNGNPEFRYISAAGISGRTDNMYQKGSFLIRLIT
jgi:hypothetical protein